MIKKFLIFNFQFIIFTLFLLLYPVPYTPYSVQATDSTQSASPSADIQNKMKALQEEIASRAAGLKEKVGNTLQNKAYIGTIKSISSPTIVVSLIKDERTVKTNEYTVYSPRGTTFKHLEVGDYIAALGDIDDQNVLTAKKLAVLETPTSLGKQVILGNIISLSDASISAQTKEGKSYSFSIDEDTIYKTSTGQQSATLKDVHLNSLVIIVGTNLKKDIYYGRFVYIPSNTLPLKIKSATPSSGTAKPN